MLTHTTDISIRFLKHVLPEDGWYCATVFYGVKVVNRFFATIQELAQFILYEDNRGNTVYHACATYREPTRRRQNNVQVLKCFFLDVDRGDDAVKKNTGYIDAVACYHAAIEFCRNAALPRPTFVASGTGLHVYWPLEQPLTLEQWLPYARGLKRKTVELALRCDPARTSDAASILRTPGTHNRKRTSPAEVKCDIP
jgi:hypothetical protein